MIYDCIIIGAGASGLFCSASFEKPVKGLILEKTKSSGTKLLMSGNGQCNITHGGSIKDFIQCYGNNGGKIRKCLYQYSNLSFMEFLKEEGIKTVERDDGKIFPATMSSKDILNMLLSKTKKNGFEIKHSSPVHSIKKVCNKDIPLWQISSERNTYMGKTVIIAAGGRTYPSTGSDGSIFKVLSHDLDIKVTELRPALASIQIKDYPYGKLAGISFENTSVAIYKADKKIIENTGGFLFTHNDISGPSVLNISKYANAGDTIVINYLAPLRYDDVFNRLKTASQNSGAELANIMAAEFHIPKRFCHILTEKHGLSLKKLAIILTGETFEISSTSGFNKAMCTAGGIDLSQLNLSSMEFKTLPGLFAIGEVLDIDGITGGYNLQFAYSSARAAATRIAKLQYT